MEDLTQARRERVGEVIERVHSQIQRVLTDSGIEPATARHIAATRIYYVLPAGIRNELAEIEAALSEQFLSIFAEIQQATKEELEEGVRPAFGTRE
ncbi:MAG: hypothetical protein EKK55_24925 [Rhodocyclaceae bacterium]|nr:MAG: hypothetical protein EKK55_24925 [Rhodocyclaceae bacterium]